MPSDDPGQLGGAFLLPFKAGNKDATFRLGGSPLAALPAARQADELAGLGEAADVLLQIDAAQVALLDPTVLAFQGTAPFRSLLAELLHPKLAPGLLVEGFLVPFEPYEVVTSATEDDVRRFFWVWRASAVTML